MAALGNVRRAPLGAEKEQQTGCVLKRERQPRAGSPPAGDGGGGSAKKKRPGWFRTLPFGFDSADRLPFFRFALCFRKPAAFGGVKSLKELLADGAKSLLRERRE